MSEMILPSCIVTMRFAICARWLSCVMRMMEVPCSLSAVSLRCPAFLTAHYAKDKPVTKPDADNSSTITQEEAQRQATLLDMLSRFIVSLFR